MPEIIKCPNCGKRLFDNVTATGFVKIKCPRCKQFSFIELTEKKSSTNEKK